MISFPIRSTRMSPPRVSSRLGLRPPSSPPILYRAFIVTHPTTFCTPIFSPGPTRKNRWMTAVLEPVLPPLQRMDSTIKTPNGLSLTLLSSAERDRPSRRYQARRIIKVQSHALFCSSFIFALCLVPLALFRLDFRPCRFAFLRRFNLR